jgi:hypothetical protein
VAAVTKTRGDSYRCSFSVRLAKSQSRWPLSGQLAISLRLAGVGQGRYEPPSSSVGSKDGSERRAAPN